eukprot:Skav217866  [mRNA]  locus=scaffold2487:52317:58797:+ [translate_table: standard]
MLKRPRDEDDKAWVDSTQQAYMLHRQFCWTSKQSRKCNTMPWDLKMRSPCQMLSDAMKPITWNSNLLPLPLTSQDAPTESETVMLDDAFTKVGLKAAKGGDKRLWDDRLSWERKCAYKKWCSLVCVKIGSWDIGRKVATSRDLEFARGGLNESIKDALASRAASTLHARASPLIKFAKFCRDRGKHPFPVSESMVYDYIKSSDQWAPTAPRSLLLSLSFSHHVLGLDGGDCGFKSRRIKGLADHAFYVDRKKLVQRPPLTVAQVMALERLVHDANSSRYDSIASGFFLLLVFGRLRFSDAMRISGYKLDLVDVGGTVSGFLECQAERTKTSVSLERKVHYLPVAVPVRSFVDPPWVVAWMELRDRMGLSDPSAPARPSPQEGGGWVRLPLTVGAAAEWLRSLLKIESNARNRVATHSCKAALLSMAAKYVRPRVLGAWLEQTVHPVGLTELYAIAVVYLLWKDFLRDKRVIFFCDNWAAIDVVVKGSSMLMRWRQILLAMEKADYETRCLSWTARVPSASNVADPPSRGDLSELSFLGPLKLCNPLCPLTLENLGSIL